MNGNVNDASQPVEKPRAARKKAGKSGKK